MVFLQSETAVKRGPELIALSTWEKILSKRIVSVINLKGLLIGFPNISL